MILHSIVATFQNLEALGHFPDLQAQMDKVEKAMGHELLKVADELNLEANKSIRLESNNQQGYFFRVTLKVWNSTVLSLTVA